MKTHDKEVLNPAVCHGKILDIAGELSGRNMGILVEKSSKENKENPTWNQWGFDEQFYNFLDILQKNVDDFNNSENSLKEDCRPMFRVRSCYLDDDRAQEIMNEEYENGYVLDKFSSIPGNRVNPEMFEEGLYTMVFRKM